MSKKHLTIGFYWVQYGDEWQVARLSYDGWFLTGVSTLIDPQDITQVGGRCASNGETFTWYRTASLILQVVGVILLMVAITLLFVKK